MTIKIEEGKWYKDRRGAVVGPATRSSLRSYAFSLNAHTDVTADGHFWADKRRSQWDLVEEVPAPVDNETLTTTFAPLEDLAPAANVETSDEIESADYAGCKPDFESFVIDRTPITGWVNSCNKFDGEALKQHLASEALRITSGARRAAYGKPEDNFERIAKFWQVYFENTGRPITVTASDVSPLMRLMKEARLCESPNHLDSFVDLVGYTMTGAEVNKVEVPK